MGIRGVISSQLMKLAYKLTEKNVNSCCMFYAHQEKLPESAQRLKKRPSE